MTGLSLLFLNLQPFVKKIITASQLDWPLTRPYNQTMMQRPRLLLVHLVWEIIRLGLLLGLAAQVFNREGYLDSSALLLLLSAPALLMPPGVLLLYLEPRNRSLRLLLAAGKALMALAEGAAVLLVSVLGMLLARLFTLSLSLRLPSSAGVVLLGILLGDLIFLLHLLLFKPAGTEKDSGAAGIPEPPVVRVEEE